MRIEPLDEPSLVRGVTELASRDPALAMIVDRFGHPPLWNREPGFVSLLRIVLEQQVSLASAGAAFDRLVARIGEPEPGAFLALDDAALLAIGFSRQKARYGRHLAAAILEGNLDLDGLALQADEDARAALLAQHGIGPWTADIYLLTALRRPDVWPAGDLALQEAIRTVVELRARPSASDAAAIALRWRPWRSVAARLLWHDYLGRRATTAPTDVAGDSPLVGQA